jgi:hypothetical protein
MSQGLTRSPLALSATESGHAQQRHGVAAEYPREHEGRAGLPARLRDLRFAICEGHLVNRDVIVSDGRVVRFAQLDGGRHATSRRRRTIASLSEASSSGRSSWSCEPTFLQPLGITGRRLERHPLCLASESLTGDDCKVLGFVAPTDHGWFLRARPDITEVNFWRPGGGAFKAIAPGAPFFFKLKRQHNAIGGFGLFARAERLPVWRAWDVFGQANGTRDEHDLLVRLDRLGGKDALCVGRNRSIGCIAITEPVFFAPDEWVAVPSD